MSVKITDKKLLEMAERIFIHNSNKIQYMTDANLKSNEELAERAIEAAAMFYGVYEDYMAQVPGDGELDN